MHQGRLATLVCSLVVTICKGMTFIRIAQCDSRCVKCKAITYAARNAWRREAAMHHCVRLSNLALSGRAMQSCR